MKVNKFLILIGLLFVFTQCQKDDFSGNNGAAQLSGEIVADYIDIFRDMTKQSAGFSPPVASRAFGYIGLTFYESIVNGLADYQSLSGVVNNLPSMPKPEGTIHWGQAANASMVRALELYYPSIPDAIKNTVTFIAAKHKTAFLINSSESILDRSSQYGIEIANAIFEYSKTDGGHEGYKTNFPSNYTVPVGNGFWIPTGANTIPLQPYWGNNRTFVRDDANLSQPVPHPNYSTDKTSLFYSQALETYSVAKSLTPEQETIAKFWSDDAGLLGGTPPGHSMAILSQVLRETNADLGIAAEAFAKVGMSVADAFVSCWKCKYAFNLMRPVTYINQNIDPSWKPLLVTPPFPEYTSGHSVQSGATARVLSDLFGYNYSFTDNTHAKRTDINGSPRKFRSFDHAAQEAAISRLYGGIHFRQAIDLGVDQGYKIGDAINALKFRK